MGWWQIRGRETSSYITSHGLIMTHFVPIILYIIRDYGHKMGHSASNRHWILYNHSSPRSVCARPFNYCHWLARRPVSYANIMGIARHKTHSVGAVIPLFHSIPFHRSIPPFHSTFPFRWIKIPLQILAALSSVLKSFKIKCLLLPLFLEKVNENQVAKLFYMALNNTLWLQVWTEQLLLTCSEGCGLHHNSIGSNFGAAFICTCAPYLWTVPKWQLCTCYLIPYIAGRFSGELNLAVWQSIFQSPNQNQAKFPTRI